MATGFGQSSIEHGRGYVLPELEVRPEYLVSEKGRGVQQKAGWISRLVSPILGTTEETVIVPTNTPGRVVISTVERRSLEALAKEYGVDPTGVSAQAIVDQMLNAARGLKLKDITSKGKLQFANRGQLAVIINGLQAAGAKIVDQDAFRAWYLHQMQQPPPLHVALEELMNHFTAVEWRPLSENTPAIVRDILIVMQRHDLGVLNNALEHAGLLALPSAYYDADSIGTMMLSANVDAFDRVWKVLESGDIHSNSLVAAAKKQLRPFHHHMQTVLASKESWQRLGLEGFYVPEEAPQTSEGPIAEKPAPAVAQVLHEASLHMIEDLCERCSYRSSSDASDAAIRRLRTVIGKATKAEPLIRVLIDHGFDIPLIAVGKEGDETLRAWAKSIATQNKHTLQDLLEVVQQYALKHPESDQAVRELLDPLEQEVVALRNQQMLSVFHELAERLSLPPDANIVSLIQRLDTQDQQVVEAELMRCISKFGLKDLAYLFGFVCVIERRAGSPLQFRRLVEDMLFTALKDPLVASPYRLTGTDGATECSIYPAVRDQEFVEIVEDIIGLRDLRSVISIPDRDQIYKQDSLEDTINYYADIIIRANERHWPQLLRELAPCLEGAQFVSLASQRLAETIETQVSVKMKERVIHQFEALCQRFAIQGSDFGEMVAQCNKNLAEYTHEFKKLLSSLDVHDLFSLFAVVTTHQKTATSILRMILEEIQRTLPEEDISEIFPSQLFTLIDSLSVDGSLQRPLAVIRQQLEEKELPIVLHELGIPRTDIFGPLNIRTVAQAIREQKEVTLEAALATLKKLAAAGTYTCQSLIELLSQPALERSDTLGSARSILSRFGMVVPIKDPSESLEHLADRTIQRCVEKSDYQTMYNIAWKLTTGAMSKADGEGVLFLESLCNAARARLNRESAELLKSFVSLSSVKNEDQRRALQAKYEGKLRSYGPEFLRHFIAYVMNQAEETHQPFDAAILAATNIVATFLPVELSLDDVQALLISAEGGQVATSQVLQLRTAVKRLYVQRAFLFCPKGVEVPPFPDNGNVHTFVSELVRLNPTRIDLIRARIELFAKREKETVFYKELQRAFNSAVQKWFTANIEQRFLSILPTSSGGRRITLPSVVERSPRKFTRDLLAANGDSIESRQAIVTGIENAIKTTWQELGQKFKTLAATWDVDVEEVVERWKQLQEGASLEGEPTSLESAITELWQSDFTMDLEAATEWERAVLTEVKADLSRKVERDVENMVHALRRHGLIVDYAFRSSGDFAADMSALAQALISKNEGDIPWMMKHVITLSKTLELGMSGGALLDALKKANAERKKTIHPLGDLLKEQGITPAEIPEEVDLGAYTLELIERNREFSPQQLQAKLASIDHPMSAAISTFFGRYAMMETAKILLEEKKLKVPTPFSLNSVVGFVLEVIWENSKRLHEVQQAFAAISTEDFPHLQELKSVALELVNSEMESRGLTAKPEKAVGTVESTENLPTYTQEELASLEVHFDDSGRMYTSDHVANTWMKIFRKGGAGSTTLREVFSHESHPSSDQKVVIAESPERWRYLVTVDGKMFIHIDQPDEPLKNTIDQHHGIVATGRIGFDVDGHPTFVSISGRGQKPGEAGARTVLEFLKSKHVDIDTINVAYFDEGRKLRLIQHDKTSVSNWLRGD